MSKPPHCWLDPAFAPYFRGAARASLFNDRTGAETEGSSWLAAIQWTNGQRHGAHLSPLSHYVDWLNRNAGAASVVLTVGLLVVTGWYAWLTHGMLSMMKRQADDERDERQRSAERDRAQLRALVLRLRMGQSTLPATRPTEFHTVDEGHLWEDEDLVRLRDVAAKISSQATFWAGRVSVDLKRIADFIGVRRRRRLLGSDEEYPVGEIEYEQIMQRVRTALDNLEQDAVSKTETKPVARRSKIPKIVFRDEEPR